ncbi:EcsC family protein [Trichocoleus sp. FACHB-591]|uniref:EcsC family protein n=1 Tax=Trichocoleus sp. FACHB-591 TaxID=2692872 RepID=UPI001F54DECB|nr:EcsC family protein [Trichocoleus sp. FACHB-591]
MAVADKESSKRADSTSDPMQDAIATATRMAQAATEVLQATTGNVSTTTAAIGETIGPSVQRSLEQTTETVGKFVTPIAENPLVKFAAKVPGINLLMAALGQVDVQKAQREVDQLRQTYPLETPEQLAQRIISDTSLKAGGIGLLTNFIPPLALALFAVDIAAVTALQAEMIYRIAAVYGFPLTDPTRRGEVLAIFGLSVGGSGVLKLGLSFVEILPLIGPVVGASSDAALLYTLGQLACRFYEVKRQAATQPEMTVANR